MPAPSVLVQVITGGRPRLADRITRKLFPGLKAVGMTDIEWCIREDHAPTYEQDEHPLNVYPVDWASEFARTHWRHPRAVWEPGGFFGAFPGREWAMRTGEERGYDLVLQLDDNVLSMGALHSVYAAHTSNAAGRAASVLARLAWSTNSAMTGMQLQAAVPPAQVKAIRPGFPYSVFVEKTGPGRMPYYGPFEDDVMHSLEYGLHGGPARTAAVVPALVYWKESGSKTGMRAKYDATRGLELPRRYPNNAILRVSRGTCGPKHRNGEKKLRHYLNTRGYTPVRVTDPELYHEAERDLVQLVTEVNAVKRRKAGEKMARRAAGRA